MNLSVGLCLIPGLTSLMNCISVTSEGLKKGFKEMSSQHAKFSKEISPWLDHETRDGNQLGSLWWVVVPPI
jgi:hypothetical protein